MGFGGIGLSQCHEIIWDPLLTKAFGGSTFQAVIIGGCRSLTGCCIYTLSGSVSVLRGVLSGRSTGMVGKGQ